MSKLLAVNYGHTQMLQVWGVYEMSAIGRAMLENQSVTVRVYVPELNEDRDIIIDNLHLAKDGWGVQHIEGMIMVDDGVVQAILYDNPAEADPLNLK